MVCWGSVTNYNSADHKVGRLLFCVEQRLDLTPQILVTGTGLLQERRPMFGVLF